MLCEHCGENEATHARQGYDICPTDRGDEYRWICEWVCDECDPLAQGVWRETR